MDMTKPDDIEPASGTPGLTPAARIMLRVVYIMGIILVLLFLALVGAIIWKATRPAEPKPVAAPATLDLGLPPGTAVQSTVIDGDRLVITAGREVIVIDVRKNQILSRIVTGP
ncbi:MAG: hypothetical protein ACKOED_09305 [Aestuariivirga sp.]|uniref:hypothetical protein n=1 Tax=Aestuariivirga sp. TaxID=2650926 RepID=UPI0038CFB5AA